MSVEQLYQDIIIDHYREKHHSGLRAPFGAEVHHVNPSCGDEVTLRVSMDGDTIGDVTVVAVTADVVELTHVASGVATRVTLR